MATGLYRLVLRVGDMAALARPGQFVNVLTGAGWDPLLRRPMSIAGIDGRELQLLYKVVGNGTAAMSRWQSGDVIDLLGPLGNGWDTAANGFPVLLGGGAGIAPVYYLHKELLHSSTAHHLIMGARSAQEHFLQHDPQAGISLSTDDGSAGVAGTVLDALQDLMEAAIIPESGLSLYGCGPAGMMRALANFAGQHEMDCQLALEEIMACGIGLCQGCNVAMRLPGNAPEHSYHQRYRLSCIDGPVFKAKELATWQN